eukprot:349546_1
MSSSLQLLVYTTLTITILSIISRASQIEDCCCDTETVNTNNQEFLNEILTVLRKRTFFRIFKVDIYKSCKLWPDNTLCFKPTCSVQECCDEDIPQKWKEMDPETRYNKPIDLFVSSPFDHWNNIDEDQWVSHTDNQEQMIYVDLESNPDGYTGYKGEEAGNIWQAIYEAKHLLYLNIAESHFDKYDREDRVLFRLISGFHTLTTCMVFANWPMPNNPQIYGPNVALYEKVLHRHQDWIENLYFDFVFLLRAVNKASDVLKEYDYSTGNPSDDAMTMGLMNYLLQTDFIQIQCNHLNSFDESTMFQEERREIITNFRNVWRNISEIIDCVGCEKCKLHAKCELLGLGTALKILFTRDVLSVDMFERNEMLALIVTLAKYSDAIQFVEDMEEQIKINKLSGASIDRNVEPEDITKVDIDNDLDVLMDKTFDAVFAKNVFDSCNQWRSLCHDLEFEQSEYSAQNEQIATKICGIFRQHCINT